ncbi:Os06g0529900 [Oryza sativa Japonica Group]|jgi:hypothetical protein|uniref:Os06g0529900 protein n=2 Tax=Oryza sativa TaxID=4530 RepID=A0A0P0WXD2_ORYSJ|nr:hypothetical protein OsI_23225 [Oryza sativa Indica Group]BAS98055.1 Os06g0529900 [Oryza sativa Japonica Group]
MGNCLNPASKARRHGGMPPPEDMDEEEGWCYATPEPASATATATTTIGHLLREEEPAEEEDEEETAASAAAAGVKVKVVLKRAELEWLMSQLKTGDRRLEDVLNQMATARALSSALSAAPPPPPHRAGDGWRPRLECILECHELAAT